MTEIFTNQTTDFDGSGAPTTAVGDITITLSGTAPGKQVTLALFSRSDAVPFAKTNEFKGFGRFRATLVAGDDYYFTASIQDGASANLSVV